MTEIETAIKENLAQLQQNHKKVIARLRDKGFEGEIPSIGVLKALDLWPFPVQAAKGKIRAFFQSPGPAPCEAAEQLLAIHAFNTLDDAACNNEFTGRELADALEDMQPALEKAIREITETCTWWGLLYAQDIRKHIRNMRTTRTLAQQRPYHPEAVGQKQQGETS